MSPDGGPAVVLADRAWSRLFGCQDIVGTSLQVVDGASMPIIGVASPDFVGVLGRASEAWVLNAPPELALPPFGFEVDPQTGRQLAAAVPNVTVFGALPEGGDPDSVLSYVSGRLGEYRFDSSLIVVDVPMEAGRERTTRRHAFSFGFGDADRVALGPGLEPSPDKRREVLRRTTWLAGIVMMLLLMAFVSVLEYQMAENIVREEEQNVRIAIGAAPMDLFRQALAENLIVAVAMAGLAWLTAGYVLDVLAGVEPFASYLGTLSGAATATGLAAAGLLLASALAICMGYVSWFVARSSAALSRSGQWLRRTTRRALLVVGTASLVAVLSLTGRYLGEARVSLGFRNPDVTVATLSNPQGLAVDVVPDLPPAAPFVDAIEAIPGVHAAATANIEPLASAEILHSFIREVVGRHDLEDTAFFGNSVTPGFFRTLGVEMLAGRTFEGHSFGEVVVSRSAAEALGGVETVLGSPLRIKGQTSGESEGTIVGVVDEVPYGGNVDDTPMVYSPIRFVGLHQRWLVDAEPSVDVADALSQLPQFAGWEIERGDTPAVTFRKQFLARRSVEIVLSVAAAFALVLSLSGVANSLARTVAETRSQIGIRFALGATPSELARAYLGSSILDLALAGVVVGAAVLAAKAAAPRFSEALELWLLLPALLGLIAASGLMIHALVGQLARRQTVNELVHGTVTQQRAANRT